MTREQPDHGAGPPPAAGREGGADADPAVIRDRRRVQPAGGKHAREPEPTPEEPAGEFPPAAAPDEAGVPVDAGAPDGSEGSAGAAGSAGSDGPTAGQPAAEAEPPAGGRDAELAALQAELDERTRDLQRVTAEFANYRKRVERDRDSASEQATANVLGALLPVLDDLDRAREHGELAEGVAAVADQLAATTAKFGLTPFGEKGDPFDPTRHEAVAHQTSPEVTQPTCVDVLRRGYLSGDRLLRPAMVVVADPDPG